MELITEGGRLKSGGVFKLVAVGYFLGATVIILPFFVLIFLLAIATGGPVTVNDQVVEGQNALVAMLPGLFIVPLILAFQAVLLGLLSAFGVWLYQKRRPIRFVEIGTPRAQDVF